MSPYEFYPETAADSLETEARRVTRDAQHLQKSSVTRGSEDLMKATSKVSEASHSDRYIMEHFPGARLVGVSGKTSKSPSETWHDRSHWQLGPHKIRVSTKGNLDAYTRIHVNKKEVHKYRTHETDSAADESLNVSDAISAIGKHTKISPKPHAKSFEDYVK